MQLREAAHAASDTGARAPPVFGAGYLSETPGRPEFP